jgi:DNA polymerase-3 subunit delta'
MTWSDILEHEEVRERFRRAAGRRRLASTFLFVGPPGVGKRTFALKLAQALLCETNPEEQLEPCGQCPSCVQVAALTHPDLELVAKPDDKNIIPLELFIGDDEHRNRQGLCHRISFKPMRGRRKIAIIDDADHMNAEGANCLLKTLEEPPPRSIIILIGTSERRQLPTIRSRSQIVRFGALTNETVARLLLEQHLVESQAEAQLLAELADGSVSRALALRDADLRDFRRTLRETLAAGDFDAINLSRSVGQFVDAAGKEAPPRRERLRQVMGWAAEFYRGAMRQAAADGAANSESRSAQPEKAAAAMDRCLDAIRQVDANANQATLIDGWLDDLARAG